MTSLSELSLRDRAIVVPPCRCNLDVKNPLSPSLCTYSEDEEREKRILFASLCTYSEREKCEKCTFCFTLYTYREREKCEKCAFCFSLCTYRERKKSENALIFAKNSKSGES